MSFENQTTLLLSILGQVLSKEGDFVLKGGTAINFLWQELPRLSFEVLEFLQGEQSYTVWLELRTAVEKQ